MTTAQAGRRTLPAGTRPLDLPPFRGYAPARRRPPARTWARAVARDLTIIVTVWAATAPLILWLATYVVAPMITGGTP